jgi:hypothetical protein
MHAAQMKCCHLQGLGEGVVAASSFRTSYVPLNKQSDFIDGMQVRKGC